MAPRNSLYTYSKAVVFFIGFVHSGAPHLILSGPQSRLGANYLEFEWFVPLNGTAVLKGFELWAPE